MKRPAKPSKFLNKKTVVDGIEFDSLKESRRYGQLRLLERAGEITNLEVHPKYVLSVNDVRIGTYAPDFRYQRSGQVVCEDVKSKPTITEMFRWKAKHLKAEHGITVEVVL